MTEVITIGGETHVIEIGGETHVIDKSSETHVIEVGHQGPPGPPGLPGDAKPVTVGASPISGHSAVALNADGLLIYADCTDASQLGAILGVVDNAYATGAEATVQTEFDLTHVGWTFSPGPVFVGTSGALVQTLPPGALFAQVVGYALSPTRIRIDVQPPIALT